MLSYSQAISIDLITHGIATTNCTDINAYAHAQFEQSVKKILKS